MKNKIMMVDLDNTIISFVHPFIKRLNDLFQRGWFENVYKRVEVNDVKEYEFSELFKELGFKDYKKVCKEACEEIAKDVTFYDDPVFMPELNAIVKLMEDNKDEYRIVLNTKVMSLPMMQSKVNFIKNCSLFDLFDEIIIDYEKGGHTPKDYKCDILIDDAPMNIETFLNSCENGLVYLPLWNYNKKFVNNERVKVLDKGF